MLKKVKSYFTQKVVIPAWLWFVASFFAGGGIAAWIKIIMEYIQLSKLKKSLD